MIKTFSITALVITGAVGLGSFGVKVAWNTVMPTFGFVEIGSWQAFLLFIILLLITGVLRVRISVKVSHDD